jgi:hypothetical protein
MLGQHVLPDVHLRLLLRVVVAGTKWGIAKVEQCSCSLCEMVCFGNEIGNHFWRPRRGMEINYRDNESGAGIDVRYVRRCASNAFTMHSESHGGPRIAGKRR